MRAHIAAQESDLYVQFRFSFGPSAHPPSASFNRLFNRGADQTSAQPTIQGPILRPKQRHSIPHLARQSIEAPESDGLADWGMLGSSIETGGAYVSSLSR